MKVLSLFLFAVISMSQTVFAEEATFKMYKTPYAQSNPDCDVYTELKLDVNDGVGTAVLAEKVRGFCMIVVDETPRVYNLELDSTSCGTNIYISNYVIYNDNSKPGDLLTVEDNRGRLCRDMTSGDIVIEEQIGDKTIKLYSQEQ
jgi:hypothetical protein